MLGRSDPVFGDSSGDPSESPSYKPTKDTSTVSIIQAGSLPSASSIPSETPNKYHYHVQKEQQNDNSSNMLMEYPSGDPTGAPSTMPTGKPSSNPRSQTSLNPDVIKKGIQESQESLQIYLIIFIIHIISSFSSKQRATRTRRRA